MRWFWRWLRRKLSFHRPAREVYLRTSRTRSKGGSVEIGIEYRSRVDDVDSLRADLYHFARSADDVRPHEDAFGHAISVESEILRCYPDRAYFIESWFHDGEDWIQIFQPYGVPRNE